jgi:hypothetical protein
MRDRLKTHCDKILEDLQRNLANPDRGAPGANMARVCDDAGKRTRTSSGKRSHHKSDVSSWLPVCGAVDMSIGTSPWSPVCLFEPAAANVCMEVTAGNFQMLFDIVHAQLAKPTNADGPSATPKRSLRRRESDPRAPKGSPGSRVYHVASKGWVGCVKTVDSTPRDNSVRTTGIRTRRSFIRIKDTEGSKAGRSVKTGNRKRTAKQVLAGDDDSSGQPRRPATSSSEHE